MKKIYSLITVVVLILIVLNMGVLAQEHKIGAEDVLAITFWQQPQLNTNVRVSQNGTIVLPVIGSIVAEGLTTTELATRIVDKISVFNRNISQASVVVTTYGSKKIYVTGHVNTPGKYTFEVVPDLWKIILEAGGPAETAMLSQVKIIRGGAEAGKTLTVDLANFLSKGDISKLPPIYPGDTVHLPGISLQAAAQGTQAPGGVTQQQVEEDVIYVYGEVARPGGYRFTRNMNLLEAIIVAGGPAPAAKLDEVRVIMQGEHYSSVATVNLDQYAKMGTPASFLLNPGDTIFIPQKKSSAIVNILQQGIGYQILRVIITAGTSILLYNFIRR